jgi:hypothetical protein
LFLRVAKLGRFDGSTGGVGFWKEKEEHSLAAEIRYRHILAIISFQAKFGSFVGDFKHWHTSESVESRQQFTQNVVHGLLVGRYF